MVSAKRAFDYIAVITLACLLKFRRRSFHQVEHFRNKPHVVIYSKPDCHLCDEAKASIKAAQCAAEYTLNEINIETDPVLMARYRYDIPVITVNGREAFKHRVKPEDFKRAVRRAATDND
jgi:glutaredoxin